MSQQKMFATVKPMAVATAARNARIPAPTETAGNPRKRTAQSSGPRHFSTVAANT